MKYIVKTPVEGFTGISASLLFSNGKFEGEINNPNIIDYFRKNGYEIEEIVDKPKTTKSRSKKEDK